MRIAFFGGSFDPPHRGHIKIAQAAAERLGLDQVLVAPVGDQPLKPGQASAGFADRLAMVRLAVIGEPRLVASEADAPRADGEPNYTFDTLIRVRGELGPGDALFCLIGADSLLGLRQWHRAADLLFVCGWVAAGRPGFSLEDVPGVLPEGVGFEGPPELVREGLVRVAVRDGGGRRSEIFLMPDLREDVSATDIRAALGGHEAAEGVLAPAIREYIAEHGLYR